MSTETQKVDSLDSVMQETKLVVATMDEAAEVPAVVEVEIEKTEVRKQAEKLAQMIYDKTGADLTGDPSEVVEDIGADDLRKLGRLSTSLKAPIKNMADLDSDSNKLSTSLIDLKVEVESVNPSNFNFEPGWITRLIYMLTGSTAVNKYVTKFSSTESVIESITRSLNEGRALLETDNICFKDDQANARAATKTLAANIEVLKETSIIIDERIATEEDPEKVKFLQEEVMFPLSQHLIDLEQTRAVASMSVIALGVLISNNKELIRSVKRATTVTTLALKMAATLVLGLNNQKAVLKNVEAVNSVTNDLLMGASEKLKDQGASIQKQASSASLDLEKLATVLNNVITSVEDVQTYKREAIPEMKKAIQKIESLNDKTEAVIVKMEDSAKIKIS